MENLINFLDTISWNVILISLIAIFLIEGNPYCYTLTVYTVLQYKVTQYIVFLLQFFFLILRIPNENKNPILNAIYWSE